MQNHSLAIFVLGLFVFSVVAVTFDDPNDELIAITKKGSDFVTKLNSSYIPDLDPGEYMIQFTDPCPGNPLFDYNNQLFFIYLPTNFKRSTNITLGVIAFISHTNEWGMWSVYKDIFDKRNIIYFSPQNVGNMVEDLQRHAAGSAGIAYLQGVLPLDPARIYSGGLSGGARIACQMGFDNGTWISGVIGICGCDYKRKVVIDSTADPSYGFYNSYPLPNDVLAATLRVVIITGTNDFLETNLNNIYYNGIVEDGLTGWLLDIPGMGHEMTDHDTFNQAVALLDDNPPSCQFPCKSCTSRRDDCTACFDSLNMSLFVNKNTSLGTCIESCPAGFYSYNGLCLSVCPEGTTATNNGFKDICSGESTEEVHEISTASD